MSLLFTQFTLQVVVTNTMMMTIVTMMLTTTEASRHSPRLHPQYYTTNKIYNGYRTNSNYRSNGGNNCPSFASCAPPRFDNFLDSILGTWSFISSKDPDLDRAELRTTMTSDVEEVMRSCGGAVQGVKEIQYTGKVFDRMYHNRADDGFVYFDCGSYSAGPTSVNVNSNLDENDVPFVSSLSFSSPTKKKSRTIISTSPNCNVSLVKGKSGIDEIIMNTQCEEYYNNDNNDMDMSTIKWQQEILCTMASPTQPWMLQRAKWQKYNSKEEPSKEGVGTGDDETQSLIKQKNWIRSYSYHSDEENKDQQPWQSKELTSLLLTSNKVSRVIQIGSVFDHDNVKAVLRCYNDDGILRAVILQSGICQ